MKSVHYLGVCGADFEDGHHLVVAQHLAPVVCRTCACIQRGEWMDHDDASNRPIIHWRVYCNKHSIVSSFIWPFSADSC